MPITKEQYQQICEELDSDDYFELLRFAREGTIMNLYEQADDLHQKAKYALDYQFGDSTEDSLERLLEGVEDMSIKIFEAIEALEKIEKTLSKTEDILAEKLYDDGFENE